MDNRQNKIFTSFMLIGLTVIFLIGFYKTSAAQTVKPIKLNYASFIPTAHIHHKLITDWATEIGKRTNGKIAIDIYPGGTLIGGREMYSGVVKGVADIGTSLFTYTPGRFPLMEGFDLTPGFNSSSVATRVLWDVYNEFKPAELEDTKVLYVFTATRNILISKKPVNSLEDLQGMEIRCSLGHVDFLKLLGATPVPMAQGEAYEALSRGVVKGSLTSADTLKGYKDVELINYITVGCFPIGSFYVVMNLGKWNSLPKETKEVFDKVSKEWMPITAQAWDQVGEENLKFALDKSIKIITLSNEEIVRWKSKLEPIANDYIKKVEAKGLPGRKFVNEISRLTKEYIK